MVAWPIVIGALTSIQAAIAYWLVVGYLWLMYREFLIGPWLEARPLLYAATHQVIIFPLCAFSTLVSGTDGWTSSGGLTLGLQLIGPFFAYEVCRKLDPDADRVLMTYLTVYGKAGTFAIIAGAVAVSAGGALLAEYGAWLWLLHAVLLLSATTMWWRPSAYRVPEILASVLLVAHLWIVPIAFWLHRP
jgi:4-hydroxybenzoate polyprenyltransferase